MLLPTVGKLVVPLLNGLDNLHHIYLAQLAVDGRFQDSTLSEVTLGNARGKEESVFKVEWMEERWRKGQNKARATEI
jgi:hypothetical protein